MTLPNNVAWSEMEMALLDGDERVRTALHEAGHAIIAVATFKLGSHVTIVPDENSLGFCAARWSEIDFWRVSRPAPRRPRNLIDPMIRREALTTLGGCAGEEIFSDWPYTLGDVVLSPHPEEVRQLAAEFDVADPDVFLEQAAGGVGLIFRRPVVRRAVLAVAEALLERDTLTDDETYVLMERAISGRTLSRLGSFIFDMEISDRTCRWCNGPLWWAPRRRYCSWQCEHQARSACRSGVE